MTPYLIKAETALPMFIDKPRHPPLAHTTSQLPAHSLLAAQALLLTDLQSLYPAPICRVVSKVKPGFLWMPLSLGQGRGTGPHHW